MKLKEYKSANFICPSCKKEQLEKVDYNKIRIKKAEGKDYAPLWCKKCRKGYIVAAEEEKKR